MNGQILAHDIGFNSWPTVMDLSSNCISRISNIHFNIHCSLCYMLPV